LLLAVAVGQLLFFTLLFTVHGMCVCVSMNVCVHVWVCECMALGAFSAQWLKPLEIGLEVRFYIFFSNKNSLFSYIQK